MTIYRGWMRGNGRADVVRRDGRAEEWLRRPPKRPTVISVPWSWGDESQGTYELALAILYDWGMPLELANMWTAALVADVLQHQSPEHFTLTGDELATWLINAIYRELFARQALPEDN